MQLRMHVSKHVHLSQNIRRSLIHYPVCSRPLSEIAFWALQRHYLEIEIYVYLLNLYYMKTVLEVVCKNDHYHIDNIVCYG